MHVAVSKGAKEKQSFEYYVDYFDENRHIPSGSKAWIDAIRKKGNVAAHRIVVMTEEDAKQSVRFVGMLLKIVYEYPASLNSVVDAP